MSATNFREPPPDIELNAFSRHVFDTLARHTSFPWPVLATQCSKMSIDPRNLTPTSLESVLDMLAAAVGQFTSPETREAVARELLTLSIVRYREDR